MMQAARYKGHQEKHLGSFHPAHELYPQETSDHCSCTEERLQSSPVMQSAENWGKMLTSSGKAQEQLSEF